VLKFNRKFRRLKVKSVVQVGSAGTSGVVFEVLKPVDCYSLIYRRQFVI
jgi:hypothetical protein